MEYLYSLSKLWFMQFYDLKATKWCLIISTKFIDKGCKEYEEVLEHNTDSLNMRLVGKFWDQQPDTSDNWGKSKDEACEQPNFDSITSTNSSFIARSIEHVVRYG